MSKLEDLTREHANSRCPGQDDGDIVYSMCIDDYILGFKKACALILEEAKKKSTTTNIIESYELNKDRKFIAIDNINDIVKELTDE